jgi:hypothetical protein
VSKRVIQRASLLFPEYPVTKVLISDGETTEGDDNSETVRGSAQVDT